MKRRPDWVPSGYLTTEQVKRLLSVIKSKRDLAIFTLAYNKGLRASEVGLLQLSDLRMDASRIFIHRLKGSISAEHKLNPDEVKVLRSWLRERGDKPGALFPSNRGTGIKRTMIANLMNRYREYAHLPVERGKCGFRVLKHSIATAALRATRDIAAVQDFLGHKDIHSTLAYAKVVSETRDETVDKVYEAMK